MRELLDIIGSSVFAGIVILLVLMLNTSLSTGNFQTTLNVVSQENAVLIGDIINYDLHKIGYHSTSWPAITSADTSGNLKFKADIDNDGSVDSVQYIVSSLSSSSGQRIVISRKVNLGSPVRISADIDSFKVAYLDSIGNQLAIPTPTDVTVLRKIRSLDVKIYIRSTTNYSDNSLTQAAMFWEKKISPKNIQTVR